VSTTKLPQATHCKSCLHEIDSVTALEDGSKPSENDLSICISCGTISMFDKELNIIPTPPEKLDEIKIMHYQTWLTLQKAAFLIKQRIIKN
jgi:hypothetical protein